MERTKKEQANLHADETNQILNGTNNSVNHSKKRIINEVSNHHDPKAGEEERRLNQKIESCLAIYRNNFCNCNQVVCKEKLAFHFKVLMKKDLNAVDELCNNMVSIMTGSPQSDKQVNILIFLLQKINVEKFDNDKMDEILNLFLVIYLKCSQAVKLTFVDDIDKVIQLIRDDVKDKKIFFNTIQTYNVMFCGLFQFKKCLAASATGPKECTILRLPDIWKRCKRYDPESDSNHNSKIKMVQHPCNVHGNFVGKESIFHLQNPQMCISFICFLLQFKFKLLNIEDININEKEKQRKDLCNLLMSLLE